MRLNLILAAALLASLAANVLIEPRTTKRNWEYLPEMVRTASYASYSANPNFADGRTLQLPPAGTLARGAKPFPFANTEADALRAGEELQNPYLPEDLDASARGRDVYVTFCQACHGAGGRGDGPVAMRGFPAPPPLNSANAMAMRDGRVYHLITYGQKKMPAYAAQIGPQDRWRAVLYVRTLQRRLTAPAPEAAEPTKGTP